MINHWDESDENWVTHYGVRYGKWKFLNFRRENFGHYRCEEGWENDAHFRYLFPQKKAREAMTRDLYFNSQDDAKKYFEAISFVK